MSEPLSLDRERLATALSRMGWHYQSLGPNGFQALFSPASAEQLPVHVLFAVAAHGAVLEVGTSVPRVFGADDWPGLLGAINNWHRQHRWPTGYLDYLPVSSNQPPLARLVAEYHMPLTAGIHDELLVETLSLAVDSCIEFLHQLSPLASRSATVTRDELEQWFAEG